MWGQTRGHLCPRPDIYVGEREPKRYTFETVDAAEAIFPSRLYADDQVFLNRDFTAVRLFKDHAKKKDEVNENDKSCLTQSQQKLKQQPQGGERTSKSGASISHTHFNASFLTSMGMSHQNDKKT